MAVNTKYAPIQQAGNGVTVTFSFAFKIFAATDLAVYAINALGVQGPLLTYNVDYTVVFDPEAETGSVTYIVAPVNNGASLIKRNSDNTQGTRWPRETVTPAKATENAADKLTMLVQELQANAAPTPAAELSGTYAARPVAPTLPVYYTSTDRGSYEKWVPALGRWILLG